MLTCMDPMRNPADDCSFPFEEVEIPIAHDLSSHGVLVALT